MNDVNVSQKEDSKGKKKNGGTIPLTSQMTLASFNANKQINKKKVMKRESSMSRSNESEDSLDEEELEVDIEDKNEEEESEEQERRETRKSRSSKLQTILGTNVKNGDIIKKKKDNLSKIKKKKGYNTKRFIVKRFNAVTSVIMGRSFVRMLAFCFLLFPFFFFEIDNVMIQ
ncbi:chloroquine resistance marker protein [Reticulomyxa filosa]|uniref:Chloroquine resistance marker protein n=1 Tax=Reticulomyxa filosa TaxID=46433 RepID=X6MWP9_RETFI|nr:chloroquine resistance marker protein [Reticulomyxa filosa]|eukprot:ETO18418.1 chloroquine resistance marker protein [Reticulomyxa filosa]